jgi:hypothetical protein
MKPTCLRHTIDHGAVLRLGTQARDDGMALRGPRDVVVTQEHRIARDGLVSVRTTRPVSVSVDNELRRRGTVKKQAIVEGALEVAKDPLRSGEMVLPRVVHVEAHLLDRVRDVEPDEGEVLESPDQATVGGRVADGVHVLEETFA